MARILAIGVATLDVIDDVDGYPAEDDEVRAVAHRRSRGGNAANSLAVLSQLGHECIFAGVLPEEHVPGADVVLGDFSRRGIDCSACPREATGTPPTSHILVNRQNGSRTIVHYRDFPELGAGDFSRIDLEAIDWLHFEARNVPETARMLADAAARRPDLRVSLEVEKARDGLEKLLGRVRVLLFSSGYARSRGFDSCRAFLRAIRKELRDKYLFCSWGETGAAAVSPDGVEHHCAAALPPSVVETLGAGDVFNAGVIDGLLRGLELGEVLAAACALAGRKCGQRGFDGLAATS
jgi:ketohexokinase